MRSRLEWTAQAREDLIEIYVTIASDNVDAAERWLTAIEKRVGMLAERPRMGKRRPEIAETARSLVFGAYLVLYELHPETTRGPVGEVEIVRVVHGMRDLSRLV